MIKQLKKFTVQLLAGANLATVVLMVAVGYSDHLNPVEHPVLACMGMTFPVFLLVNLLFLFVWLTFKWRMMWIPIAGYCCAYVPISIYMPLNVRHAAPDDAIKLISYNVCAYGGNYKYEQGFEVVCDYLKGEQPDIVCLQEDTDTWRRYVMQHYSKFLAYNDTCKLYDSGTGSVNGLGIHTRYPIIKRERIPYSSEANGSVAWWLRVDGDTLIVINNHFESCHLTSDDRARYRDMLRGDMEKDSMREESKVLLAKLAEAAAKRGPQIDAVARYVEEYNQYPMVVCGDFNDTPISYSRYRMSRRLTDAFVSAGRGLGLSYMHRGFFFRIDHVFCSKQLEPYACSVDRKMDASDHFPIVCYLKMRKKP